MRRADEDYMARSLVAFLRGTSIVLDQKKVLQTLPVRDVGAHSVQRMGSPDICFL